MSKTVLIARSHTFIVSVMKPFLEECGYGSNRLEHISDLQSLTGGAAPRVPVLFAAMLTLEQARPALERIAKLARIQTHILGLDATPATTAQLGRQETFLYFSKDDLTSPQRRTIAAGLVQRHFR